MNSCAILFSSFLLVAGLCLSGCASSEETGSSHGPQQRQAVEDSLRLQAKADSLTRADSLFMKRGVGSFTSKQDTVEASLVRRSKSSQRPIKAVSRPENPAYTVQIGAFLRPKYALQAQKLAKERFADLPVFNQYEPFDKFYRVSVGLLDGRAQADSLRRTLIKKFPSEYSECWINYISK